MQSLFDFFITNAHADTVATAATNQQAGGFSFITMLVIFFAFMYFMVLRPQSKRAKEQQTLLGSLAQGDEVVTAGGLLGRISKIKDQYLVLTISPQSDIVIQKSSIVNVLPKGTLKTIE